HNVAWVVGAGFGVYFLGKGINGGVQALQEGHLASGLFDMVTSALAAKHLVKGIGEAARDEVGGRRLADEVRQEAMRRPAERGPQLPEGLSLGKYDAQKGSRRLLESPQLDCLRPLEKAPRDGIQQGRFADACFAAGTPLWGEHGSKAIEQYEVGERLWSRDEF